MHCVNYIVDKASVYGVREVYNSSSEASHSNDMSHALNNLCWVGVCNWEVV